MLHTSSDYLNFRMDVQGLEEFVMKAPTLLDDVLPYKGISRAKWNRKLVTLKNNEGQEIENAVIQNVDPEFVAKGDGKPLSDDQVVVQIAKLLCEDLLLSGWMWSIQVWHIKQVMLNSVRLYDHHETNLYNEALKANKKRVREDVCSYNTSHERGESKVAPKKGSLLTPQAILEVSTKSCCGNNYLQLFPWGQIEIVRSLLHLRDGFYERTKCLLEVHRQIHKDVNGKKWITLKGREVYPKAWWIIHGISKSTFYRYKEQSRDGKQRSAHGNVGLKKPRLHTMQATATLRTIVVFDADRMPHKTRTLESGEKVTAMVLPSTFRWSDQLPILNKANDKFNLQPISSRGLSHIWQTSFAEYASKARGNFFARCRTCDQYKQLKAACILFSHAQMKWSNLLEKYLDGQRAHKELYYDNRHISKAWITIIHDKMDHSKIASPHFSHKTKTMDSFMKLLISVTSMIAYGHGGI